MRILDWYIARVLASTSFITLAVFVGLSGIIKFVDQMPNVGKGTYDISLAALYVFFTMPRDVEMFFPMAALIGGLVGLGTLASSSELVVMQAAGLSKLDIIKSVMKSAVVLILISMSLAEWVAPPSEVAARELKAQAISGGSLITSKYGIWAKDGDFFVNIGEVEEKGKLNEIEIYRFNSEMKLYSWLSADSAVYQNQAWTLSNVIDTTINEDKISDVKYDTLSWRSSLTPEKLGVVTVKPESLSIGGLVSYLDYLESNSQDSSRYMLAFWRKATQPFTVAVMLLVALSFIFGPLRSVSMGARIMMGVFTGILFHVCHQALGAASLVYQLPPLLGASSASVIFIGMAIYLIKRKPT